MGYRGSIITVRFVVKDPWDVEEGLGSQGC